MEGVCQETRLRLRLSVAAYAYEVLNTSIMTDSEFDALARQVNLEKETARPDMDLWFTHNFSPDTGMWIWKHPDLPGIARIYASIFTKSLWETIIDRVFTCHLPLPMVTHS